MSELFEKKCVPCEGGVPALDLSEIHKYPVSYTHLTLPTRNCV